MAVYFLDSSALVKRYINEIGSLWVLNLFDPVFNNEVLIATIASVEIVAAITRRTRGGSISVKDATAKIRRIWEHLERQTGNGRGGE